MEDDEALDIDFDITLAEALKRKRKAASKKKKPCARPDEPPPSAEPNLELPQLPAPAEQSRNDAPPPIEVSEFDFSVENHFKFVDTVAKLCGYPEIIDVSEEEIERLSHSITFLREWRDFKYAPRAVKFAYQRSETERDVFDGITLSQFSAAAVPKEEVREGSDVPGIKSSKDFVCHVGGAVWALDWCPRVESDFENHINCEFVAVAAHPPESSYHKVGAYLTGRGVIQIWCLLTVCKKQDAPSPGKKRPKEKPQKKQIIKANELDKPQRPRGRPRKQVVKNNELDKPQRPRGRPRKKALPLLEEKIDDTGQCLQPLAIEYPEEGSAKSHSSERNSENASKHVLEDSKKEQKESTEYAKRTSLASSEGRRNKVKRCKKDQAHNNSLLDINYGDLDESCTVNPPAPENCRLGSVRSDQYIDFVRACDTAKYSIPKDIAVPRMMLCLAHNGKVAWDVKWRPACATQSMKNMGYLAVLLGNGALEVWEVPLPQTVKLVYPALEDCADPRFIKLLPVFRCSMLRCGDRQSIPLTVEWRASSGHDMILAGCHDGLVALWAFSVTDSSTETRPLLVFSADMGPVRTLAWAPVQSDLEGGNIIVTGGHKGIKFWDIRDPFHPLWEHALQGATTSLDWLPSPSCVFGSIDDGTLLLLNFAKATANIPVTGKSSTLATKQGVHNFDCSAFSIWSVQTSRHTGIVAYCGVDGTTLCFQMTTRTVNDPSRNRLPHCICGSLLEEGQELTIVSPMTDSPFSKRTPSMKRRSIPENDLEKRPKEQTAKGHSHEKQKLAISQERNPVDEFESGNSLMVIDEQSQISKEDRRNKSDAGQGIPSCRGEDVETLREENKEGMEVLPPKTVAMYRVRWSVNKGSQKWLCYGGAAGLIRFQEIDLSVFQ